MKQVFWATALMISCSLAHTQAQQLSNLPDDARATVLKELTRQRITAAQTQAYARANADSGAQGKLGKRDECNLDIGSSTSDSRGGRRNTTTVITGSVVQVCGR